MGIETMTKEQRMAVLEKATGLSRITKRVDELTQNKYVPNGNGFASIVDPAQRRGICLGCGKKVKRATILSNRRWCTKCGNALKQKCRSHGKAAEATPFADPIVTADHLDAFLARFTGDYACEY